LHPIGVYFSASTRNRFPDEFVRAYRGVLILLMQKHLDFQVVTARNIDQFRGETLVLPDVRVADPGEQAAFKKLVSSGKRLVVTGSQPSFFFDLKGYIVRFDDSVGELYDRELEKSFAETRPESEQKFLDALRNDSTIRVTASPLVATSMAEVEGAPHIYFANFAGLKPHEIATPTPQKNVTVEVQGKVAKASFLPFLGEVQQITGQFANGKTTFTLPAIERGAVLWFSSTH
jgi:hypothetical protein